MEVMEDAYNHRLSLSSSNSFPEANYVKTDVITYRSNDMSNDEITTTAIALCNLLYFNNSATQELLNLLKSNNINFMEQFYSAVNSAYPAGINSGFYYYYKL
jgi:hypothetical protein